MPYSFEWVHLYDRGDRGAVSLTEDEGKLRKWMVCGPEISLIQGFYSLREVIESQGIC